MLCGDAMGNGSGCSGGGGDGGGSSQCFTLQFSFEQFCLFATLLSPVIGKCNDVVAVCILQ